MLNTLTDIDESPPLSMAECIETCHKIRDMIDGWFANIETIDDLAQSPKKETPTHEDSTVLVLS
jgi:hypothetical protein